MGAFVRAFVMMVMLVASALTATACLNINVESSDSSPDDTSLDSPATDSAEGDAGGDDPNTGTRLAEDEAGVTAATVGTAVEVADWTVAVVEAEIDAREVEGVTAAAGMTLLKAEVELTNNGDKPARVNSGMWTILDGADAAYAPEPADRADWRGDRNIPQGKTEEVTVYFELPDTSGGFMLRFDPSGDGTEVLSVPVP